MTTLNISLPESIQGFVNKQIVSGKYSNASEYILDLIGQHLQQVAPEELEATLPLETRETSWQQKRSFLNTPEEFVGEMRIAAAVKWYELGEISQGKAAEIARLSRSEFIDALARYRVDFMQYTAEELAEEMENVD